MKKSFLILFLTGFILSSGCTLKEVIGPDGDIKITNVSGSTGGTGNTGESGTGTTTGTTNSSDYQPVTKGSTWTYKILAGGLDFFKFVYTMNGKTTTENGVTLNQFDFSVPLTPETDQGYYANSNHLYTIRQTHSIKNNNVEVTLPYLKDDAAIGDTWQTASFDAGTKNYTAQYTGKMLERNITKVINNTTFTNVYHTHTELVMTYPGTGTKPEVIESYDYFIAKGVGIIELDEYDMGTITEQQIISSYTIK